MAALLPLALALLISAGTSSATSGALRMAIVGDQGQDGPRLLAVSRLVGTWGDLDGVLTTGDNNYEGGAWETLPSNVAKYWGAYLTDDPATNRFWPCPGNHDWGNAVPGNNLEPYLRYFKALQGRRYYDRLFWPRGADQARDRPVLHAFFLSTDPNEDRYDGTSATSVQAQWLRGALAASNATWKIVFAHHPPYSSGHSHHSSYYMRWPFAEWGADVVLSGHQHSYERMAFPGEGDACPVQYIVNGVGGAQDLNWWTPFPWWRIWYSDVKFNDANGAQLLTATHEQLTLEFRSTERRYPLRDCWRRQAAGSPVMDGPPGAGYAPAQASFDPLALLSAQSPSVGPLCGWTCAHDPDVPRWGASEEQWAAAVGADVEVDGGGFVVDDNARLWPQLVELWNKHTPPKLHITPPVGRRMLRL